MKDMMKAAMVYGARDVRIDFVPIPKIADNEVLVKVKACGVCPFDLRVYSGTWLPKTPMPVGHEVSGIVEEVGKRVAGFEAGDRVSIDAIIRCNECYYCRRGKDNLCERKGGFSSGFAEYIKIPSQNVFKFSEDVSFEEAALSEPLACCVNATEKTSLQKGDSALIVGAGPMGLMFTQLYKISGMRVIITEILEHRLKKAEELGADFTLNPSEENIEEKIFQITGGVGANAVILTAANQEIFRQALKASVKTATVVFFAAVWPPIEIGINPNDVHYRELVLVGAANRTLKQFSTAVSLISKRLVNLKPIISNVLPLEKIREAFEIEESRKAFKVVVAP